MTALSLGFSLAVQLALSFGSALLLVLAALAVAEVRSPRVRATAMLVPFLKAAWDFASLDWTQWALAQGFDLAHRASGSLMLSVGVGLRDWLLPLVTVGLSTPATGGRLLPGDVLYVKLGARAATWLLGAAAALAAARMAAVFASHAAARRELAALEARSRPLSRERLRGRPPVRRALAEARLEVRLVPGSLAPVLAGFRRPRILIGEELVDALTSEELAGILGHELGHLERRDPWLRPVLASVGAAVGFLPGVGRALELWALEAEKACDRRGVSAGAPAPAMARALWKAHELSTATRAGLSPALSAFRSNLGRRIEYLTQPAPAAGRAVRLARSLAGLALAAAACTSTFGVW